MVQLFRRNMKANANDVTIHSITNDGGRKDDRTSPATQDVNSYRGLAQEDPWNDVRFREMSQLWSLSEEEQSQMRGLQQRLLDIDHWKNDPYEVVRFFRELKSDVAATEVKFRKMVSWRLDNDIDHFLERYGEPDAVFDYFPSVILEGVDKDGDPIFLERTGVFDAYGFFKEYGTRNMVDFMIYKRETIVTRRTDGKGWQHECYEPKYGKPVKHYTVVMDVAGLNRNHMRAGLLPLLHQLALITQDYYAGLAKRIIVLRAPLIWKLFWGLIKHFFEPYIRELVIFTTEADYLEVLDQYVDREVLPSVICREHGKGNVMTGFENIRLEGGLLTEEIIQASKSSLELASPRKLWPAVSMDSSEATSTTTKTDEEDSCSEHALSPGCAAVGVASRTIGKGTWDLMNIAVS